MITKIELIEYEIWRKSLPMTLRNSLDPSNIAMMYINSCELEKKRKDKEYKDNFIR